MFSYVPLYRESLKWAIDRATFVRNVFLNAVRNDPGMPLELYWGQVDRGSVVILTQLLGPRSQGHLLTRTGSAIVYLGTGDVARVSCAQ